MEHCGACVERGIQQDVVDFEHLRSHQIPNISDAGLHCSTRSRRNETIRRAIGRSDPIALSAPEIAVIVHANRKNAWDVGGYYDRYRKAASREGYKHFRSMASRFGIDMEGAVPTKKKSRRNRVRVAHDRNLKVMNILLFAFEYGYDPVTLSVAVNREQPASPLLSYAGGSESPLEFPLAA